MKAFIMPLLALTALIVVSPMLAAQIQSASAMNNCPVKDDKVICVFNIKKGDLEAKQLTIGPFNINSGGGGGGTVDQQARDQIQNLTATVGVIQGENAGLAATVQNQGVQVSALAGQLQNANGQIANLTKDLQELKSQVILDVNLTNGSTVTPVPQPPVNNTGNATGNQSGGGGVTPPVNNTGNSTTPNDNGTLPGPVTNETGNATGGGNATGTNSTGTNSTSNDTGGFVPTISKFATPHITYVHTRGR